MTDDHVASYSTAAGLPTAAAPQQPPSRFDDGFFAGAARPVPSTWPTPGGSAGGAVPPAGPVAPASLSARTRAWTWLRYTRTGRFCLRLGVGLSISAALGVLGLGRFAGLHDALRHPPRPVDAARSQPEVDAAGSQPEVDVAPSQPALVRPTTLGGSHELYDPTYDRVVSKVLPVVSATQPTANSIIGMYGTARADGGVGTEVPTTVVVISRGAAPAAMEDVAAMAAVRLLGGTHGRWVGPVACGDLPHQGAVCVRRQDGLGIVSYSRWWSSAHVAGLLAEAWDLQ